MRRARSIGISAVCGAFAVAFLLSSGAVVAQNYNRDTQGHDKDKRPPPYNPYPPGILPPDLVSEIARVRREVRTIEREALAQWQALTPPVLTGQPPILQGTGMRANQ